MRFLREFIARLLILILFVCAAVNVFSEEVNPDETVYLMEEIVVTGKKDISASVTTVGDDFIRSRRSASVADVLSSVPGASVAVGYKNSSEIMIRGFSSHEVLIMVDGRPVNEPYYGTIDLSTLGVGNISKIKVMKGPASVRFGPNSMGGVVNIITGGSEGSPMDISITAGSGNQVRTNLVHCGYLKGIGYRIHIGRSLSRGFPLSDDFKPTILENGGIRDNSYLRRTDFSAKLLYGERRNPRWSLSFSGSHLNKGLPSSVSEARFWRFRNWNRTSIDLDGEPIRSESFRLKTKLYMERFLNELVDYMYQSYDPSRVFFESIHKNHSAGILLSSAYNHKVNGLTNFGSQLRWEESNRQNDKGQDWFINRTSTTWIFAGHERFLTGNLFLRSGISGHYVTYDNWNKSSLSFDPSLSLTWSVRGYTFHGAVSRVSRFPTLHQLYSRSSGNKNLDPEWALKTEISASRTFLGCVDISMSGFYNKVHDMILRSGSIYTYKNIQKAKLNGMELSGIFRLPTWNMFSSITLIEAKDGDGEKLEYRPSWKIDSGMNYRIHRDIYLHFTSRITGSRWTENDSSLKGYHVVDAGIVLGESRIVSLSMSINNVFDRDYVEELGFPMPGRTFWIGIDSHLSEKQ